MSGYNAPWATRVVVGVSGSLGSVTVLRRATALAHRLAAELWPVLAWTPPGGDPAGRRSPVADPLAEEWQGMAEHRLTSLLDDLFGEEGPGLPLHAVIVRGTPGPALLAVADREDDLLVVGAGRRGLRRAFSGRVSRQCLAHARCPVLAVPPSPLESDLTAVHRRNTWHWRMDIRGL
ncbi:universal stress protein [Streptomyces griseoluteus]|uniref:universal stress protein n=1 Tax=Streptomyces TaxID=1883 RepID=UPI000A3A21FB|nr:universal stress protein [Streptomyces recifensis]